MPGSVLVREGVLYCAAGRNMFLEGGVRLLRLDAATGKLLGETLFIAGPPNTLDEEGALYKPNDPDIQAKLAEQAAAMEGRRGAVLWAVRAADGRTITEVTLDAPPVWDGMAAAGGRLYMAMRDGTVRCLGGKHPPR